MIRPDIQAWLSKMIADDPHGAEAAALLSRLVVFIGAFDQGVIASRAEEAAT